MERKAEKPMDSDGFCIPSRHLPLSCSIQIKQDLSLYLLLTLMQRYTGMETATVNGLLAHIAQSLHYYGCNVICLLDSLHEFGRIYCKSQIWLVDCQRRHWNGAEHKTEWVRERVSLKFLYANKCS